MLQSGQVTVSETTTFKKERKAKVESNRVPSTYQPNSLPLLAVFFSSLFEILFSVLSICLFCLFVAVAFCLFCFVCLLVFVY